jgi:hypothetical protein
MKPATTTRSTHYGNDLYREISAPGKRRKLPITYWDVWFLVVLLTDFAGDWEKLADRLRQERQGASLFSRRDTAEELLNHLRGLRHTLTEAALTPEAVLGAEGATLLRTESNCPALMLRNTV